MTSIDVAVARVRGNAGRAAMLAAEHLRTVAVENTPIQDGVLRNSARVEQTGDSEATVSFNTVYARVQHESEHFNHPKGGRAKFLSGTAKEIEDDLTALVRAVITGGM